MKKGISLFMAALLTVSMVACGNGGQNPAGASNTDNSPSSDNTSNVEEGSIPVAVDGDSKEAPSLAQRVEAGELEPLAERLPVESDIMVEQDVVALGEYGGSITLQNKSGDRWGWGSTTEQALIRFKQDGTGETEANVAKNYYANDDYTVWTIELREGMRWSDGAPFTADDIVFYYNHMGIPALNEDRTMVDAEDSDYYPAFTSKPYGCYQVTVDGTNYWAEVEKADDYTVTVTFAAPKPSFDVELAIDNKWMFLPKHFYINYVARKDGVTDDASFPLISEEEALENGKRDFGKQWESYSTMSKDIGYYHWDYAIVPQVRAFIATEDNWDKVGETYRLVRNPYFWKTDSEGRQLPYIDSLDFRLVDEEEQISLMALSGEFDIVSVGNDFSTVASGLKDSHSIYVWGSTGWCSSEMIQLNQTVKDDDLRALFQDVRFREALSIAVDRNLLNETLRNGILEPAQASPGRGSAYFDEEWYNKWTEYDVDKANQLLDEITEPWDGTEGTYRKFKDSNKDVHFTVTMQSEHGNFYSILESSYRKIGIQISDKVTSKDDERSIMLSNDLEAAIEAIGAISPALRADAIVPTRNTTQWLSAYGKWYEDGKSTALGGWEPEGDVLKLVESYDIIRMADGSSRDSVVAKSVEEIFTLHKENIWIIGYLSAEPTRSIVSNKVQNFKEGLVSCDEFRFNNLNRPEQWWVAE